MIPETEMGNFSQLIARLSFDLQALPEIVIEYAKQPIPSLSILNILFAITVLARDVGSA